MKKVLKWTIGLAAMVIAGLAVRQVYTAVTTPIPEADLMSAGSALEAARRSAANTGIEVGGLLYEASDGRTALAVVPEAVSGAAAKAAA